MLYFSYIKSAINIQKVSVMNRAIKYRLYPAYEQAVVFAKTFGCCRKVYNLMPAGKIET